MDPPFTILFDELNNYVEIQYDGMNQQLLLDLIDRVVIIEGEIENDNTNEELDELEEDIASLTTLVQAQSSALTAEIQERTVGDLTLNENFTNELIDQQQEYSAMILAETEARGQAILDEATARGAAIAESEAIIMTDVAILATTVEGLATEMGAAQSSIIEVSDALVTETMARTAQYSALQADYGDTNAAILEESVARSTEDEALAYAISIIEVGVGDNTAAILAEQIARTNADEALAMEITTLSAQVDGNTAAISSEAAVRATADSAMAEEIDNLQVAVGDNTAAVAIEAAARIEADGTIESKYTVKVDINGHVAGYGLIATENDGEVLSTFIVTVDSFQVYNGSTPIAPFYIEGGTVYMQNVVIDGAYIKALTVYTIQINTDAIETDKVLDNAITSRAAVSETSYFMLPYSAGGIVTEVASLTFTGHGGYTEIDWFIPVWHTENSNPYGWMYVHFRKDGESIGIWNVSGGAWLGEAYLGYVKKYVEPALSGEHTYSIGVEARRPYYYPMPRGISIVEYKK